MVRDHLNASEKKVEERLNVCPTEDSVAKRFAIKATSADYGGLVREFRELQRNLNPLIEKGYTLTRFIKQVTTYKINEVNTKDIH